MQSNQQEYLIAHDGYSLIEFLSVLSIISIISLVAFNALYMLDIANQMRTKADIYKSINFARQMASLQMRDWQICGAVKEHNNCVDSFAHGIIIKPRHAQEFVHKTMYANSNLGFNGNSKGIYYKTNGGTNANGRFFQCLYNPNSLHKEITWSIVINLQGRVRIATPKENKDYQHLCAKL